MRALQILFLLLSAWQCYARQTAADVITPSMKYGKPTKEELKMTTYAPDTAAKAVVLYSKCNAHYELNNGEFRLIYAYETKIKVLKSEGTSVADIVIPYFSTERSTAPKENVTQIDASAYNLENGKIVRTKMKRDLIFKERINKAYMQVKFSIPSVREGTVFEYKYQVNSGFYYVVNDWEAQQDIPVIHTQYDITIPEYFQFNVNMRGSHQLSRKKDLETLSYPIHLPNGQMEQITCTGNHMTFTGEQLPAIYPDNYVWCTDDFMSGVSFELRGINFPGSPYQSFSNSWKEIDQMLLEDEEFGSLLKMRNPYRNEMASLSLDKYTQNMDKIAAIYTFLKKKISWNGTYSIYGDGVKKAVKNGTGSNADINFVLMSMLRDAQIPCYPVVMSRKDLGMLPLSHPSLQRLNTFVVGIADTDSTLVFLDGSVTDGFINTLPPVLLTNRARLLDTERGTRWVDLSLLGKNQIRSSVEAKIQPDGTITGTRKTLYSGQHAANFRNSYHTAKDSAEFINKLETEEDIRVTKFSAINTDAFTPTVTEHLEFEKQASVNDQLIYVNPLIFMHVSKCPFTQAERQLPLEMPYHEQIFLVVKLDIPEGYAVDEMPQPMSARTENNQSTCRYLVHQEDNQLVITYSFHCNQLLYPAYEYKMLKAFWETIAKQNTELVVLKKI